MHAKSLLSQTENKLILGFFLTLCCVFYLHFAENVIESYNNEVRSQQFEKQILADNKKTSMFSCYCIAPPFYVQFFWLQFFLNPAVFLLLRKPRLSRFVIAAVINLLIALSLLAWNFRNYNSYLLSDLYQIRLTFFGYLEISTNKTAFILAVLSFAFFILQFSILVRFAVKRFQAKISLR
jgi:hypothetical protein